MDGTGDNYVKLSNPDQKDKYSQVQVAHTYNPSYSGIKDQEDHGSKSAPGQIVQETLSWKKPITK
jgi:hypothetical protein